MKKKRKNAKSIVTALAVACALVMNVTPMSAGIGGGLIEKIVEFITGEEEYPCWWLYENPEGCCHFFTYCPCCCSKQGIPEPPKGKC